MPSQWLSFVTLFVINGIVDSTDGIRRISDTIYEWGGDKSFLLIWKEWDSAAFKELTIKFLL